MSVLSISLNPYENAYNNSIFRQVLIVEKKKEEKKRFAAVNMMKYTTEIKMLLETESYL